MDTSERLAAVRQRLALAPELMEVHRLAVMTVLGRFTGAALARELDVVEIALSTERGRWEAVRCFEMLHQEARGWTVGGYEVRRALVASVAARQRTWLSALEAADELRRMPDQERADAIVRLCQPPKQMDNAHTVYLAAARAAAPEALPSGPVHRGGPIPSLGARAYAELALWLAEQVRPLLSSKEELDFARRALDLVRAALAGRPVAGELEALGAARPKQRVLQVVRAPLLEARHALVAPDKVGPAVRPAAKTALALLGTTPARAMRYLLALDEEILRLDCATACERQASAPSRLVDRALWRGADGKGKVAVWIMELEGGSWALLAKLGRRWTLLEGSPDEILASVPSERFDEAVHATRQLDERVRVKVL